MPEPSPHEEDCDCGWCRPLPADYIDNGDGTAMLKQGYERTPVEAPEQKAERIGRETTEKLRADPHRQIFRPGT